MKVQTQTPLSVLRGHSHAILLVHSDGVLSPALRESVHLSGCSVEFIGHPLFAMAALVWHEANARDPKSRGTTAFIAADVEIDNLNPLFDAIRNRLPHVSAWVFQGDLALLIAAAQPRHEPARGATPTSSAVRRDDETKTHPTTTLPRPTARSPREFSEKLPEKLSDSRSDSLGMKHDVRLHANGSLVPRVPPQLRIAEGAAVPDPAPEAASQARDAHVANDRARDGREFEERELEEIERHFGRRNHRRPETSLDGELDREVDEEPPPSAVRLTPEEIAMLMGDVHPEQAPQHRQVRGSVAGGNPHGDKTDNTDDTTDSNIEKRGNHRGSEPGRERERGGEP
ncbi:MAG: hypothetical protein RIR10_1157 [Planctomycetota bacterium]